MLVGRGGYILANIGENLASGLPKIGKIASSFLAKALGAHFTVAVASVMVSFMRNA